MKSMQTRIAFRKARAQEDSGEPVLTDKTRLATTPMTAAQENVGDKRSGKKTVEAFVTWKKTTSSSGVGKPANDAPKNSTSTERSRGVSTSSGRLNRMSRNLQKARDVPVGGKSSEDAQWSSGKLKRQQTLPKRTRYEDGEGNSRRPEGEQTPMHRRKQFPAQDISSTTKSTTVMRRLPGNIFERNSDRRFCCLRNVRKDEGNLEEVVGTEESKNSRQTWRTSVFRESGAHDFDGSEVPRKCSSLPVVETQYDALSEEDDEAEEERIQTTQRQRQSTTAVLTVYDANADDNYVSKNDDEGDPRSAWEEEGSDGAGADKNSSKSLYATQAERKKERRKERAWRDKEGTRRMKDGLPRNFLLVDEYTRKPYGVGVGDWRKEVMLLSRDLDPAIGNINRQPEGAVAEIVEWIQHTWEYSFPIKFEYVKEVIARGVTLRRVELWKKIRNGDSKPDGMSDRTWRTLARQLDNPASIRKSENCRRANASRINFGRTGPSGEVGIWQRLKRILRRSPNPDEMRFEMSRDKGYGGRKALEGRDLNVMHGSEIRRRVTVEDNIMIAAADKSSRENTEELDDEEPAENTSPEVHADDQALENIGGESAGETLKLMSTAEISRHPFVVMMMERLEALEGRRSAGVLHDNRQSDKDLLSNREEVEGRPRKLLHDNSLDAGRALQEDEGEGGRTLGRKKKKAKQGLSLSGEAKVS